MHNITFTDIHSESTGLIYAERMDSNGNQMVITDSTFEGIYIIILIFTIIIINIYCLDIIFFLLIISLYFFIYNM